MNIITTKSFEFEDRQYEIRVVSDGQEYKVAVFLGDKRANGYTYTADVITDLDLKRSYGIHAYEHLMDVAESDVCNKFWESYLAVLHES